MPRSSSWLTSRYRFSRSRRRPSTTSSRGPTRAAIGAASWRPVRQTLPAHGAFGPYGEFLARFRSGSGPFTSHGERVSNHTSNPARLIVKPYRLVHRQGKLWDEPKRPSRSCGLRVDQIGPSATTRTSPIELSEVPHPALVMMDCNVQKRKRGWNDQPTWSRRTLGFRSANATLTDGMPVAAFRPRVTVSPLPQLQIPQGVTPAVSKSFPSLPAVGGCE